MSYDLVNYYMLYSKEFRKSVNFEELDDRMMCLCLDEYSFFYECEIDNEKVIYEFIYSKKCKSNLYKTPCIIHLPYTFVFNNSDKCYCLNYGWAMVVHIETLEDFKNYLCNDLQGWPVVKLCSFYSLFNNYVYFVDKNGERHNYSKVVGEESHVYIHSE